MEYLNTYTNRTVPMVGRPYYTVVCATAAKTQEEIEILEEKIKLCWNSHDTLKAKAKLFDEAVEVGKAWKRAIDSKGVSVEFVGSMMVGDAIEKTKALLAKAKDIK